jgi:hypothetical protein
MSMTITDCPRCHQSFMYDANDLHLHRAVAWDFESGEAVSWETICQDCHEKEQKSKIPHKYPRKDFFLNLYLISLYVSWGGAIIIVLRLFMFKPTSGVFTLKFSLWADQQLSFGVNKFILLWLYDHMMRCLAWIKR